MKCASARVLRGGAKKQRRPTRCPRSSRTGRHSQVICYCICYFKGIFIISHEVVCSCILSIVYQLRSHFERCWNPPPGDPLSRAQTRGQRASRRVAHRLSPVPHAPRRPATRPVLPARPVNVLRVHKVRISESEFLGTSPTNEQCVFFKLISTTKLHIITYTTNNSNDGTQFSEIPH